MRWKEILKKCEALAANLNIKNQDVFKHFIEEWEKSKDLSFYTRLQEQNKQLLDVLELNTILNSRQSSNSILMAILDKAIETTRAERGFLLLGEQPEVTIARNFDKEWIQDPAFKISRSIAQSVLTTGKPLVTSNAQEEPGIESCGSVRDLGLRSVVCLPLKTKEKTLGVLYLDNRFCLDAFSCHFFPVLQALADQVSLVIYNTQLMQTLDKTMQEWKKSQESKENARDANAYSSLCSKEEELSGVYRFGDILSVNLQMKNLFQIARQAALSDVPILITGESGTGKGLLAKAIHQASKRKNGPMVSENCAAIPDTLLESELFGYVQGAFTGAMENKKGLFSIADKGTLFLDEVGDMSLSMQGKLLKALETGTIRPVGSSTWQKVDIRILCATHRHLPDQIAQNLFREDLWYRLRVVALELPPLRQRIEDIPVLVQHFLSQSHEALEKKIQEIESSAMEILLNYPWPGNIRELEHEIKKIVALKRKGEKITKDDVASLKTDAPGYIPIPSRLSLKEAVQRFENNYILQTLSETKGNKTEAARLLGVSRRSLYNKFSPP